MKKAIRTLAVKEPGVWSASTPIGAYAQFVEVPINDEKEFDESSIKYENIIQYINQRTFILKDNQDKN